jgi:tetratricopeptide (TPR) repeat protein
MPRRYFNWKLVAVLVIGLVVLGITAFGLRKWQRSRMAYGGLDKGNQAYDKCLWEEAAKNLGRYLAVTQDDVPVLLKYANAQLNIRPLKRNNIQQAIAAYRTVLRINKDNSEASMRLVEMYLGMGMAGEAELIATRALEANHSPELQRMLAMALINQRKFKEAASELEGIIKEHPEQILAYGILGQLTEQRPEDFSQTPQLWLDEAVKNNPSSALAYIIRGGFYLRTNDKVKALSDLEHAEKLDLSDHVIRLRLAGEFINANILDKAEEHLTLVHAEEPTSQPLWQTWAQLALKSQSKAKMLEIAETGLKELSSQPWDFMPVAAELYIRCDELERASDCISKLREKDIAPAATAFLEGLVSDRKGQSYEAVKCWYRAIQSGGESARVRLALAATLSRLDDKQSAIRQLRTLLSEQPNLFDAHINLARLFIETANWAEAAEQARIARQIFPSSLDAALLYVQARIHLLAESQTDKDSPMWRDIKDRLTMLENATDGALEVKLLQFRLAMQQGNFAEAETLVTELKKAHPSQIRVAMAEVELLAAQDKSDDAILLLNNIVEKFPQDSGPVRYLAILLARQDKREKCEGIVKTTLSHLEEPDAQRELGLLLADLYDQWGQEEKAYTLLTSLAEKLPNDIPIKRRLLRCKQVIKNLEKAQQLVNDIKSLEGEDGWQWRYEQAITWFAQENFQDWYPQIISLLKENLLANPDDLASRTLLAQSYERAGELQLAISTYQEALTRAPRDIRIIVPAVAALYRANEYDRADEILRQAANEKLFHPELKRLELQSYLRRGELSSAGDILENLLADDPNNVSICLSLALLKMRQNRFAEAGQLLTKLKVQEPNALPVTIAQIELNIRQNKSTEAISLCDEMVNKFNNASAYILRARTYAMLGQADKAEENFKHATVIEPNNVGAWVATSDFYRSTAQLDTAIADIRKAMSLEPDNLGICKRAVPLFLASGSRDTVREGKNILDKALTSNPEDIELRLLKARSLLAEGTAPSLKSAVKTLQEITEEQPKIAQTWTLLGEIALRQGQPTKAMDVALQGLAYQPDDKSLLLLKARAEAVRSPALAIPTLKALQELDPNDADAAVYLANTYLAANQIQEAVNLLKTQLVSYSGTPDERKINIALAVALHKNNSKLEAQEIFNSLYQSAPDDPGPLLAQARLLKDDRLWDQLIQMVLHWCQNHPKDTSTPIAIAGDLAAAENSEAKKTSEDILRMILHNNPDEIKAIVVLAALLQTTGRPAESATLYQQVLELQPDNVIAINNLAWILCEERSEYQQALELVQRGLKIAPDYIDLIDTRGVVYYKLGQYDKAVRDFTRCLEMYPDGTPAATASYLHLGRALASLRQKDKAIENLKKTLELNTKTGGLSAADLEDAQRLLEELSRGG